MENPLESKPWLKSYRLGPYKLKETLEPYPRRPLFSILDDSADRFPNAPASDFFGRRISYRDLREKTDRLAAALAALGIGKGDKVATILPTCPQYLIGTFAILKAGATHVPCSLLHREPELVYEIGQSGAKAVICLDQTLPRLQGARAQTSLQHIIATSIFDFAPPGSGPSPDAAAAPEEGVLRLTGLIDAHPPEPPPIEIDPLTDLAYLAFTGGSTGYPKGVMLTHYNRLCNVHQGIPWMLESLYNSIRGKASVLASVPFFHSYGDSVALTAIYMGLRLIMVPDPRELDTTLRLLVENRPFLTALVPTQMMQLAEKDLPRLPVQIMSGSAHLPPEVREKISAKIKMPVSEGFGLTETSPITHLDLSGFSKMTGFAAKQKFSIGVPVPDTEIKLVDEETGRLCGPGEPGHMHIRGPQVMLGYWPEPGNGLEDGWLPTGDIARMDEDGYFYIVDRVKNMANVSGYKVYTSTVDEVLFRHPAVTMAAAIGVPDPARPGSERIKAFVVLNEESRGSVTAEEIIEFCRDKMASYAVPRWVEFRDELPFTVTEKIFKRQLRDEEIAKMKEQGLLPD